MRYLITTLFVLNVLVVKAQTIHYVTTTGAGNLSGSSWANASNDIQAMINGSSANDEIWVAAGTYKPNSYPIGSTNGSTNRDYAFTLKNDVSVYGGFVGTETILSQRNPAVNITTLSGDFNNDDLVTGSDSTLSINNNTENAYHVVVSSSDVLYALLDGFTIKGGNANGTNIITGFPLWWLPQYHGGGLFNYQSNVTIAHCYFQNNRAEYGGAAINQEGTQQYNACTFNGNMALNNGGAMRNFMNTTNLTSCSVLNNVAQSGGGIDNTSSSVQLSACDFLSNYADSWGGGIHNVQSNLSMNDCSFIKDTSIAWGGALNIAGSGNSIIINRTEFRNNYADSWGGALNISSDSISINQCVFDHNEAGTGGGGIMMGNGKTIIRNSLISSNSAGSGDGLLVSGKAELINSTIVNNFGEGIRQMNDTSKVINCIFWNNTGTQINNLGSNSQVEVSYSIIQGGYVGINNLSSNPNFINTSDADGADNIFRTSDDGFAIQASSPAINASNPSTNSPTVDITGFNRIGVFDIGAYESEAIPTSNSMVNNALSILSVFPNPTYNNLYISNSTNVEIDKIYIIDLVGRNVMERIGNVKVIDITSLNKGVYILQSTLAGKIYQIKFVKE